MKSYLSSSIFSITFTSNSGADISGCKSYVATFGEGINSLSSPLFGSSTPPLKKNVTWAYFSVSAALNWVLPNFDKYSPNVLLNDCGPNAILTFGKVTSYSVKQTKNVFMSALSNPVNSVSTIALDISLAPVSYTHLDVYKRQS